MKSGKTMLLFLTGFLFVVAGCLAAEQIRQDAAAPLSVEIAAGADVEHIQSWADAENNYYIFLPSYADLPQTRIHLETGNPVYLDGELLSDGMSCEALRTDTAYALTYTAWGRTQRHNITFVQSGNVPTLYVDTASGSMDYIHAEKGNEESGEIRLYAPDGALEYEGNLNSINGRGNNTWEAFEKKPYSIELSEEADLLGMGSAQKWILLANADDPSNMRNKIVYDFANTAGLAYSPSSQWIDLYLNGEYAGLYLLCERNEVHPERVNIAEKSAFLISMEMEKRLRDQNYPYVLTKAAQALRIHYPEDVAYAEAEEIYEICQSVENAILSEDGVDFTTGKYWKDLIDIDSWVLKYLIEEIFESGDACYISQFFYYDGSGKMYAGPVWDFDHSIGNEAGWQLTYPNALYANRLHVKDGYDTPWFFSLYKKEEFHNRVVEIYQTVFRPLLTDLINDGIYDYHMQISEAAKVNQIRWFDGNYDLLQQAKAISSFMENRVAFLNRLWTCGDLHYMVKADHGRGSFYGYFTVFSGECLSELPIFADTEHGDTFLGWYHADTGEPFDPTVPIYSDIELCAKWGDSSSKKMDQIVKLMPLAVIALMGVCLLAVEVRCRKKGR